MLVAGDVGDDPELDLRVVGGHQHEVRRAGHERPPDPPPERRPDRDVLEVRVGRREAAGGRHGLVERRVDAPIGGDQRGQRLDVRRAELRVDPPVEDRPDDRVDVHQLLEDRRVGRVAGLRLATLGQLELAEQDLAELLGRADRELVADGVVDLALEAGDLGRRTRGRARPGPRGPRRRRPPPSGRGPGRAAARSRGTAGRVPRSPGRSPAAPAPPARRGPPGRRDGPGTAPWPAEGRGPAARRRRRRSSGSGARRSGRRPRSACRSRRGSRAPPGPRRTSRRGRASPRGRRAGCRSPRRDAGAGHRRPVRRRRRRGRHHPPGRTRAAHPSAAAGRRG